MQHCDNEFTVWNKKYNSTLNTMDQVLYCGNRFTMIVSILVASTCGVSHYSLIVMTISCVIQH